MANELILIVEDNPKNLKLVRDTPQVKGYQTIEAETGEEGVRLVHERQPALILMDIQLPAINGIEALKRLRADPVTPPCCCSASSRWPTAVPNRQRAAWGKTTSSRRDARRNIVSVAEQRAAPVARV